MFEQFMKSILAYFNKIEPMDTYIQNIPTGVNYPCYLLNKCDIDTERINSFYFNNTITPYIRIFGKDEVALKNRVSNLQNSIFSNIGKIPILNEDGTESNRFIRVEQIESYEIPVDQNEVYCVEINFNFETTHNVNVAEFDLMAKANVNQT